MGLAVQISTDKSRINTDFVHDYITKSSYWGKGRTSEETRKTIENSLCFGMYLASNKQIGFARIVTDAVFFGNIMDVFIAPEYQGKGLGKTLLEFILKHETIRTLQTITLKTKDAHSLYGTYGFKRVGDSQLYMSLDKQKLE